jgi:hypothetical protein
MKDKLLYTNNNMMCNSSIRPDCIKGNANTCCLYCNIIEKCQKENKAKTKPCTMNIVSTDEYCPYAI